MHYKTSLHFTMIRLLQSMTVSYLLNHYSIFHYWKLCNKLHFTILQSHLTLNSQWGYLYDCTAGEHPATLDAFSIAPPNFVLSCLGDRLVLCRVLSQVLHFSVLIFDWSTQLSFLSILSRQKWNTAVVWISCSTKLLYQLFIFQFSIFLYS